MGWTHIDTLYKHFDLDESRVENKQKVDLPLRTKQPVRAKLKPKQILRVAPKQTCADVVKSSKVVER